MSKQKYMQNMRCCQVKNNITDIAADYSYFKFKRGKKKNLQFRLHFRLGFSIDSVFFLLEKNRI